MSTPYEVPLIAAAQTFQISLAGATYGLTLVWSTAASAWILDIADASGNPMVQGIPLVTGADLLEQLGYMGFGGQLVCQTDHDLSAPPTYTNLGSTGHLYFLAE